jgi:D-alanyl-D-alanine carboxypeptidase
VTDVGQRDRRTLRRPSARVRRRRVIAVLILAAVFVGVLVGSIYLLAPHPQEVDVAETPSPSSTPTPSSSPTPRPDAPLKLTFDKRQFSIDDPASFWVVVNKLRPLNPVDYVAPDLVDVPVAYVYAPKLRADASAAVVQMFADFTAETGLEMQSQSAYRSYSAQVSTYNNWVSQLGQEGADLTSARPGHSEHQTGLAIDISAKPAVCSLDQCFADTPQGTWLAANAYKYGFVLRYPDGYTDITGYEFEPWHYRYVGVELATEYVASGATTLEEFFGLPAAPTYAG